MFSPSPPHQQTGTDSDNHYRRPPPVWHSNHNNNNNNKRDDMMNLTRNNKRRCWSENEAGMFKSPQTVMNTSEPNSDNSDDDDNNNTNVIMPKRIKTATHRVQVALKSLDMETTALERENNALRIRLDHLQVVNAKIMEQLTNQLHTTKTLQERLDNQSTGLAKKFMLLRYAANANHVNDILCEAANSMNFINFKTYIRQLGEPPTGTTDAMEFANCMTNCLGIVCEAMAANTTTTYHDNFTEFVRWCLHFGANPHTSLTMACKMHGDCTDMLETLLKFCHKDVVNHQSTTNGQTCLMEAALLGKTNRVKLLLRNLADFTKRDAVTNRTAADMATNHDTIIALTQGEDVCHAALSQWLILRQQGKFHEARTLQQLCLRELESERVITEPRAHRWLLFSASSTSMEVNAFFEAETYITTALKDAHDDELLPLLALRICARLGVLNVQGAMRDMEEMLQNVHTSSNNMTEIRLIKHLMQELVKMSKNPLFVLYGNGGWSPPSIKLTMKEIRRRYHMQARKSHPDKCVGNGITVGADEMMARAHVKFTMLSDAYTDLCNNAAEGGDLVLPSTPLSELFARVVVIHHNEDDNDDDVDVGVTLDDVIIFINDMLTKCITDCMPEDWGEDEEEAGETE